MASSSISATDVARVLGYFDPKRKLIASIILAVIIFFYIFTLGSLFNINVFVLQHGVTYDSFFEAFLIEKSIDHIIIVLSTVIWAALSLKPKPRLVMFTIAGVLAVISATSHNLALLLTDLTALLSVPIITSVLMYDKFSATKILDVYPNLLLNYLAITAMGTGIISIIATSLNFLSIPINLRDYGFDVFVLINSLSPVMMVLLIFCIPVKLLLMRAFSRWSTKQEDKSAPSAGEVIRMKYKITYLLLIVILSVAVAAIPHLPTVNKNNQLIGVDTPYYVGWQKTLTHSTGIVPFIHQIFGKIRGGDRPFSLLLIYTVVKIVPAQASTVIDNLPIILGPALVLAVYFFTRQLTSNDRISLLAAFLTPVSFQVLVGIYSGFYANWIALIMGYLAFIFLFRVLKTPTKLNFVIFSASMFLMLFSHEYTWTIFSIVMGVFLVLMIKSGRTNRLSISILLLILFSTVVVDLAKTSLIGLSNGFAKDLSVARGYQTGASQFGNRWSNLKDTMENHYGAQFSNFIVLTLALYWLYRSSLNNRSNLLFVIFLSVGIPPLFFGDWAIQSRVLYDIPFQIPAAIGLNCIRTGRSTFLILVPICIWLIAISIRSVFNFVFPP